MTPNLLPGLDAVNDRPTILQRIRKTGAAAKDPEPFPAEVSLELVADLIARFPNECPEPGADSQEAMLRIQGQQQVIRLLAHVSKEQHPEAFGGS